MKRNWTKNLQDNFIKSRQNFNRPTAETLTRTPDSSEVCCHHRAISFASFLEAQNSPRGDFCMASRTYRRKLLCGPCRADGFVNDAWLIPVLASAKGCTERTAQGPPVSLLKIRHRLPSLNRRVIVNHRLKTVIALNRLLLGHPIASFFLFASLQLLKFDLADRYHDNNTIKKSQVHS